MNQQTGFFITGTDTDIGKTTVSVLLMNYLVQQGLTVAGLKPIASGLERREGELINSDVLALTQASNVQLPPERINRYAFEPAIAPHIAAQQASQQIQFADIYDDVEFCKARVDALLVEGVGGWHVPLSMNIEVNESDTALYQSQATQTYQDIAQLAVGLKLPVVMVVGMRLGCLNHALLTYRAIESAKLSLVGWVANCCTKEMPQLAENKSTLEQLLPIPLLFDVPYFENQKIDINAIKINPEFDAYIKSNFKIS